MPHSPSHTPVLTPSLRSAIDAFVVMDVMREANARERSGEDIIHMEVGQPGTPAPRLVREAAKVAIDQDTLGYTDAFGLIALRERISRYYQEHWNVHVDLGRIVITTGSSAGFVLAFLAALNPGDGLALLQPGYPCYRQIAKVLGLAPLFLPAGFETGFAPRIDQAEAMVLQHKAKALLLASPANPTGSMLTRDELHRFAKLAEARGAWLISDEIYHGLSYGKTEATALQFSDQAIVINSFSKYYSMTGWRIGWMVVPEGLTRTVERLAQNLYISAPAVSQMAAIAAFEATEELEAYKATYLQNRAMLMDELPKAGFERLAPADGAFYFYADVSRYTDDAQAFAKRMLKETGVAATPGVDFDDDKGHMFLRFSYSGKFERMREAAQRLKAWAK